VCQHEDLLVSRLELLHPKRFAQLAETIRTDISRVSPETEVRLWPHDTADPWDFEEVYGALHIPGRLLQTNPPAPGQRGKEAGTFRVIDLDLSRYDRIASRFAREAIAGPFVEVNCATLRGDAAMSALFGHVKGAFTGAMRDRPGLLLGANRGLLFLDEVAELGVDEQAMLLRALEEKRFLPLGGGPDAVRPLPGIETRGKRRPPVAEVPGAFRPRLGVGQAPSRDRLTAGPGR